MELFVSNALQEARGFAFRPHNRPVTRISWDRHTDAPRFTDILRNSSRESERSNTPHGRTRSVSSLALCRGRAATDFRHKGFHPV